ncbi:MAG TPA: translation initiation factor [Kofleriaceae bacterium]|nr:translation initiation factor [Kofleriaceae bacterium]
MAKGKDPFAELEKLRASLPRGPEPAPAAPVTPVTPAKQPAAPRAVVRMERKGRGGKEVTVVVLTRPAPPGRGGSGKSGGSGNDKLALPPAELERWCRDLKQALGCGGTVDGAEIVLQGDLRTRIGAVLEARGIDRVTIG